MGIGADLCGLTGIIGPQLGNQEWLMFQQLMIVSTLRGADGSGIAAVPIKAGKDIEILRSEGTAADLATSIEFWSMKKKRYVCWMGHARQPTMGTYALTDVHPHVCGPIVGMHNGTMVRLGGRVLKNDENDSRLLFQSIMNQGIDNTIKTCHGAYALSYIDKQLDQLCFIRNKQRPLSFCQVEGESWMAWASEADFLRLITSRLYAGKKLTIFRLNEDAFLTFRLHAGKPVKYETFRTIKPEPISVLPPKRETEKATQMWETSPGSFMTEDEITTILASGCAWCGNNGSTLEDYKRKHTCWIDKDQFICKECLQRDEFARDYAQSYNCELPPIVH